MWMGFALMVSTPTGSLLHGIRKMVAAQTGPAMSDQQLMERFCREQDQAAFAALVERHGGMVFAVCRRILGHVQDAEDACQATFLVLARKAASIRRTNSLPSWLHRVAYHVAADLSRDIARRHGREEPATDIPAADTTDEMTWREVRAVLDEELHRLPERYRVPLILCYLEGKTRDEAAHELGCGLGTLKGRLERGRERLRGRLVRRGVSLSAALLSAVISESVASPAMPAMLAVSTTKAAVLVAGGKAVTGLIAASVARLAERAMRIIWIAKMKFMSGVLLAFALIGGGATALAVRTQTEPRKAANQPPAAKEDPAVGLVRQLGDRAFKTREDAAKKLRAIGPKAIPALQAGTRDPSPEVRKRSQEVLVTIRADARDAFAKQFDPQKTEEYDHPVWKRFVAIAGDSQASRELFARIIANAKWFRTLDNAEADLAAAGHVYRVGIAEMFRDFHNDPAKSPAWPCDRPEEVAYLLLLGSYSDPNPPAKLVGDEIIPPNLRGVQFLGRGIIFGEGQITHANGLSLGLDGKIRFFNAPEIVGAAGTDRVFAKLLAAWLAQRAPSSEVVPRGFLIASGRRVPETLPIARRYAANDFDPKRDIPPLATIIGLEVVAQLGTRADLPLFERHFGDETNVAAVDKPRADGAWDYHRPAPLRETTQLRDVALGLALLLHGANPEDFGFVVRKDTFKQKDGRYTIPWSTQLLLGFESDANRTAAFKKAKAWLAEQKP